VCCRELHTRSITGDPRGSQLLVPVREFYLRDRLLTALSRDPD
jgi:hypothetical protein